MDLQNQSPYSWYSSSAEVQRLTKTQIAVLSENPSFHQAGIDLAKLMRKEYRMLAEAFSFSPKDSKVADELAKLERADIIFLLADRYKEGNAVRFRLFQLVMPPLAIILSAPKPMLQFGFDRRQLYDLRCNYDQKTIFTDLPLPTTEDDEGNIINAMIVVKKILLEMVIIQPFQAELAHDYQSFLLESPDD